MIDPSSLLIVVVTFTLAGTVTGGIGLGLPAVLGRKLRSRLSEQRFRQVFLPPS
ncbi:hypothetical protein [Desulfogranum mediterraneum]|uniref:hypothetical protein n=1 Tax=Desulfogranum mediterraneum TaxID=160661 RepID=UPI00040A0187|nr:hypothetical protein [Desulfogranum mediterraneum]